MKTRHRLEPWSDARHGDVSRRAFLTGVAATAAAAAIPWPSDAQAPPIPIIDTHIHLFDPTRPQGAPYSGPRPALSGVEGPAPGATPIAAYPERYRRLAVPLGVVGAIKVEASPWIEERQSTNPDFISGLKLLAKADLVMDTANPRVPLLEAILRISDAVPTLRIVLDHLPALDPTEADRAAYDRALQEIAKRPQIFVKLSEIIHRVNGQVSTELGTYRARLDALMSVFGEDRVLFGSDWPNSDGVAAVDKVFAVAKEYFLAKPRPVAEKYFWRNSVTAYKWVKRAPSQPTV